MASIMLFGGPLFRTTANGASVCHPGGPWPESHCPGGFRQRGWLSRFPAWAARLYHLCRFSSLLSSDFLSHSESGSAKQFLLPPQLPVPQAGMKPRLLSLEIPANQTKPNLCEDPWPGSLRPRWGRTRGRTHSTAWPPLLCRPLTLCTLLRVQGSQSAASGCLRPSGIQSRGPGNLSPDTAQPMLSARTAAAPPWPKCPSGRPAVVPASPPTGLTRAPLPFAVTFCCCSPSLFAAPPPPSCTPYNLLYGVLSVVQVAQLFSWPDPQGHGCLLPALTLSFSSIPFCPQIFLYLPKVGDSDT